MVAALEEAVVPTTTLFIAGLMMVAAVMQVMPVLENLQDTKTLLLLPTRWVATLPRNCPP